MKYRKIIIDLSIAASSLLATYLMARFGLLLRLEHAVANDLIIAFMAGMFFISFFTVVPASYILISLLADSNPLFISLIAGIGAVFGDLLIFLFIKNRVSHSFFSFFNFKKSNWTERLKKNRAIRILLPVIGAAIIASPLPDEIGVSLMGVSRIKKRHFIPISFALNAAGIYLLLRIGKAI